MKMKCPDCGFDNPSGAQFCGNCGKVLTRRTDLSETRAIRTQRPHPAGRPSAEKYKIIRRLKKGGMGDVYLAQDRRLGRTVALKFLTPQLTWDSVARKQFVREARAASALDHPNICTIYEIDETDDDRMFISMAYYRGETLREAMDRRALDLKKILDITILVCRGLEKAHSEGIVHRDIKPGNVFVTADGQVKILDFGLAILGSESGEVMTGPVGTVLYMSPEQIRAGRVDHRTDLWSLGVVLYEMLAGRPPFSGDTAAEVMNAIVKDEPNPVAGVRNDLPDALVAAATKSLAKDPDHRYQNAAAFLKDLTSIRAGLEAPERGYVPSIAVLPFVDMSPLKDQEYFCDGIAEELINSLARIRNLKVVSRTSAFKYKDTSLDIREVGRELDVKTVLEGSVRKSGDTLRITAQLVSADDGYHLWSEIYDRKTEHVFAIQDEIAQNIVRALEVTLTPGEQRSMRAPATRDAQAYDYYLRGRNFYYQYRKKGVELALQMFTVAIKHDPNYALAYSGIADCCAYLFLYAERRADSIQRADEASHKALDLDPESAEAHASRGQVLSLLQRHEEAEREFETAIGLGPRLFEAYYLYARDCFAQGKFEKAVSLYEKAHEVNPDDYQAPLLAAQICDDLGQISKAAGMRRRGIKVVEERLRLHPGDVRALYMGANGLVALGESERGLEWASLALLIDPAEPMVLYNVACIYSMAGRVSEALDCLEKAAVTGLSQREWYEHDSNLAPLRDHPRYRALLEKLR
jgi:serine/threonine protein kinase/tetratricopeptide (TPR) repeat protein